MFCKICVFDYLCKRVNGKKVTTPMHGVPMGPIWLIGATCTKTTSQKQNI